MGILDKKVSITCPSCGKKFTKTLAQLESKKDHTCPGCGALANSEPASAAIKSAKKAAAKALAPRTINLRIGR